MANTKSTRSKKPKAPTVVQLICAVAICFVGAALMIWGFCVPPRGEIHPSVLAGTGEFLTFAGALFGIDYTYKFKMHSNTK